MATNNSALLFRNALVDSGHQFAKDFLTMPQAVLAKSLKFLNKIAGVHGKITFSKLKSGARWKPYKYGEFNPSNSTSFHPRTLETFHLELDEEFDPASVYSTVFGKVLKKDRTSLEVVRAAVAEMARQSSGNLTKTIWTGVRNEDGETSLDNFDGFDTIIAKEKVAGNISRTLGNYFQSGKLTEYNIGDKLMLLWSTMTHLLKDNETLYLYMPSNVREMYDKWYNNNYNGANYTNEYNQRVLVGTNQRCVIADMAGMDDVKHIIFTTKDNMIVGFDGESNMERFELRVPNNPKMVQVFAETWMGCQILNLEKECFYCSSFTSEFDIPYISYEPEEVDFGEKATNSTTVENVHIEGFSLTSSLEVTVTGTAFTTTTTTITAAAAKAGVDIPITFKPTAKGNYTGKLSISSSTDIIEVDIPLTGKCV
ncbi:MAG: hypothetical protein IKV80_03450 [Bacteroidales bacterium]|nr:hypothetical protein [Bacteroidales bacterium]